MTAEEIVNEKLKWVFKTDIDFQIKGKMVGIFVDGMTEFASQETASLKAENEELKAEIGLMKVTAIFQEDDEITALKSEVEMLKIDLSFWKQSSHDRDEIIESDKTEIERLREGLKAIITTIDQNLEDESDDHYSLGYDDASKSTKEQIEKILNSQQPKP